MRPRPLQLALPLTMVLRRHLYSGSTRSVWGHGYSGGTSGTARGPALGNPGARSRMPALQKSTTRACTYQRRRENNQPNHCTPMQPKCTPGGLALGRANSTSRITSSVHLFESAQRRYREQQTNEQPVDRAQGNPRHRKAAQPTLPHLPDTQ